MKVLRREMPVGSLLETVFTKLSLRMMGAIRNCHLRLWQLWAEKGCGDGLEGLMKHTLFVGDYAYSSWSLRGWLLCDGFGIDVDLHYAHMNTPAFNALKDQIAPGRLVPALRHGGSGTIVWDSVAMAETLAEEAPLWPEDPAARATARSLTAEMHSGFTSLRSACPMNMRRAYQGFKYNADILSDLTRLAKVWGHARTFSDTEGPFLFGRFTGADAFFAPVASRIATYDLPLNAANKSYVQALLHHPSVQRWYAKAKDDTHLQDHYEFDLPDRPNPHETSVSWD